MMSVESGKHGHGGVKLFDKILEILRAIGAMHFAQHLRVARLQRQMQMTADAALRSRHQPNQVIGDIAGFDAGDAESASRLADLVDVGGFGKQAFEQRIKTFAAVFALLAPGTQVDAGEHDLRERLRVQGRRTRRR